MYAQWRSVDDYQAMRQDPAPPPFLQEALTMAKFEPGARRRKPCYLWDRTLDGGNSTNCRRLAFCLT